MSDTAALNGSRETQRQINNLDGGEEVNIETVGTSIEEVTEEIQAEAETSFDQPEPRTFTPMTVRNLQRAHKSINTLTKQIQIASAKVSATNELIAEHEREKDNPNTGQERKEFLENEIRKLEEENEVRKRLVTNMKNELRNQLVSIRETFQKILYSDKTLGEKLRTLFREQGVTVSAVLVAIGMTIAALVEGIKIAILKSAPKPKPKPSPEPGPGPKPGPSPEPKIWSDWLKPQLRKIADLLAKLGDKALAALPGIIASIVSFVLKTASAAVGYLSEHLCALALLIGGILYTSLSKFYKKVVFTQIKKKVKMCADWVYFELSDDGW